MAAIEIANQDELLEKIKLMFDIDIATKEATKELTPLKNAVKKYMVENSLESVETDGIEVIISEAVTSSMNNEKLMQILEAKIEAAPDEDSCERLAQVIVYTKRIDEDVLESVLYDGIISESDLAPALEQKSSIRMNIKKAKNK